MQPQLTLKASCCERMVRPSAVEELDQMFSKVLSFRCNFCNNMGQVLSSKSIKSIKTKIVKPI